MKILIFILGMLQAISSVAVTIMVVLNYFPEITLVWKIIILTSMAINMYAGTMWIIESVKRDNIK